MCSRPVGRMPLTTRLPRAPSVRGFFFDSEPVVKLDVLFPLHLARADERPQAQKPGLSYSLRRGHGLSYQHCICGTAISGCAVWLGTSFPAKLGRSMLRPYA